MMTSGIGEQKKRSGMEENAGKPQETAATSKPPWPEGCVRWRSGLTPLNIQRFLVMGVVCCPAAGAWQGYSVCSGGPASARIIRVSLNSRDQSWFISWCQ